MQFSLSDALAWSYSSWDDKTLSSAGFLPQSVQKLPRRVDAASSPECSLRFVCRNNSLRPTALFCSSHWNVCRCLPCTRGSLLLLVNTAQLFLRVYLPTFLEAILEVFLTLTTSAFSSAANSSNEHPKILQWSTFQRKKVLRLSQLFVQVQRISFHAVDQNLFRMESRPVLKQPSWSVLLNKMNAGGLSKHQKKLSDGNFYNG